MLPGFTPAVLFLKVSARLLGAEQRFINKERFQLAENLPRARCSPFVISKVLAAILDPRALLFCA